MTDLLVGLLVGCLLGAFFFGTLWITARGIPQARWPAALVLGSYLARMGILGVALYALARSAGAGALAFALAGLLITRQIFIAKLAPPRVG
ncbi:MAG: ATP synthase subunit I [Gemmatimonadota bacterium]